MFLKTTLGYEYQNEKVKIFFGNKNYQMPTHLNHKKIQQIHSDVIIDWRSCQALSAADAHITATANECLIVSTADCLPILVHDQKNNSVAAIHAGWRGVANRITKKCLTQLASQNLQIWIGPHIHQASFEVDPDVADQLDPQRQHSFEKNKKWHVDLQSIVKKQITDLGIPLGSIHSLEIDTVLATDFHSFRRDRSAGRNISWISLAPKT